MPRLEQEEIHPLNDEQTTALLRAAEGTEAEQLIKAALFTGCRLSELLGLTWDCVGRDTITISKQLAQPEQRADGPFISPKNGKSRTLTPAPLVLDALKAQKRMQTAARIKAGPLWDNAYNLVFTTETGAPFDQWRAEAAFKSVLATAELHGIRFHDLRHTYAVNAIRAGDDIKTVQGNLGHASAAFTLDRYGHFTERMKQDSAARMEGLYKGRFESVKGKLKGKHARKEHEKPPEPCIFRGWAASLLYNRRLPWPYCSMLRRSLSGDLKKERMKPAGGCGIITSSPPLARLHVCKAHAPVLAHRALRTLNHVKPRFACGNGGDVMSKNGKIIIIGGGASGLAAALAAAKECGGQCVTVLERLDRVGEKSCWPRATAAAT